MNERHLTMLSSPRWAEMLRRDLLPWVERVGELGDRLLEIGPGPGLTTDLLRERVARVTAIEVDAQLAERLTERLAGTNVDVVHGDASTLGFADGTFSAAACFAALHHMPSPATQDRVFREVLRVLRPGAMLVASDGYDNEGMRHAHEDDTFVPLDPERLPDRLRAIGFTDVVVERGEYDFRFAARKAVTAGN